MIYPRRTATVSSLWLLALGSLVLAAALVGLLAWEPGDRAHAKSTGSLFMYCAAGMRGPVEAVADQYQGEAFGEAVQLQYGGSNTLLSQLEISHLGDLFLAADNSYLELAIKKGLVKESIPLARIRPVVAVRKGNPKQIRTVDDLVRSDVRVALANPDAAAIGSTTRKLMEAAGRWSALAKHAVVYKPTVNDVANDVKLGSVDAGIVWDITVTQYPELQAVRLSELDPGEAQIAIGVLTSSKQPTAALRFARYLAAQDKGLEAFRAQGFDVVDGDIWEIAPQITIYSGGVNRVAIQETIEQFQKREGAEINVVYNGCGILVAQMKALRSGERHGAFPDAYFACDTSFMEQVRDLFLDEINVSETDMVILTRKGNPAKIETLEDLTRSGIKLGLANPDESALGELTRRLLRQLDIYEAVEKNVSTKTPTADLLVNQVKVGGLDAAVVYRANTSQVAGELEVVNINHPMAKAVQPYALARNTPHRQTASRLIRAIRGGPARFELAGFRFLPESPAQ